VAVAACVVGVGEEREHNGHLRVAKELLHVLSKMVGVPHYSFMAVAVAEDAVGLGWFIRGGGEFVEGVPMALDLGEVVTDDPAVVLHIMVNLVERGVANEVEHCLESLDVLGFPFTAWLGLYEFVLFEPTVQGFGHTAEGGAFVLGTRNGGARTHHILRECVGAVSIRVGWGGGGGGRVFGIAIVGALDAESGAALLAESRRDFAEFGCVDYARLSAVREYLKAVEGLPHAKDLSGIGVDPGVVGTEGPVIKSVCALIVLHSDILTSNEVKVVGPVSLHREDSKLANLSTVASMGANALVLAESVGRELVDDPEIASLMEYGGSDIADRGLESEVFTQCPDRFVAEVVDLSASLRPVTQGSGRVSAGKGLEAKRIRLLADKNLPRTSPPGPGPHRASKGIGIDLVSGGDRCAGSEVDFLVFVAVGDAAISFARTTRRVVVDMIATAVTVPVVGIAISLGLRAHELDSNEAKAERGACKHATK
jgi:hypothetical protein